MHHIICSAAPNHQLIDSMINLIRHVTEPGEYSSPARTERTSPAKNTAAYPAMATIHTCAAASNHGSDCVELVSSPTGKHTRTPLGLRALPAECASVARANLQPPTITGHNFTQRPAGHEKTFRPGKHVSTRKERVRAACFLSAATYPFCFCTWCSAQPVSIAMC